MRPTVTAAVAALALTGSLAAVARADNRFQVEPTRIDLSTASPAGALVVTNHGSVALRLQLSATRWHDTVDGTQQTEPTTDIVLRPAIVEIAPGKSRSIRVGTTASSGPVEATYRVFIEEMPDRRPQPGARIQVLTRIGVPVFVAPRAPRIVLAATATLERNSNKAMVTVTNSGNQHAKLRKLVVTAARDGQRRWSHEAVGWYVLPGAERRFAIDLGADRCAAGDRLALELTDENDQVTQAPLAPCEK